MSYVVQHKDDAFILFDRIVTGTGVMSQIITTVEPVYSYASATSFDTEERAKEMIDTVNDFDTTEFNIRDTEILKAEAEERKKQQDLDNFKNAWKNTSEERRKEMLSTLLEKEGPDAVKEFLDTVEDKQSTEGE